MPQFRYMSRTAVIAAPLTAAILLLAACGDKEADGENATVQMQDLEKVDGTINDAMTDLDGVQTEGTAMAENDSTSAAATAKSAPAENASTSAETPTDEEVVADQ